MEAPRKAERQPGVQREGMATPTVVAPGTVTGSRNWHLWLMAIAVDGWCRRGRGVSAPTGLGRIMKEQIENRVAMDSSIGIGRTSRGVAFDGLVDAIDDLGQFSDNSEAIGNTDFDIFTAERAQDAFGDEQQIIRSGEPIDENATASRARGQR